MSEELIAHITDLLGDNFPITTRKMFGGYGIFHNKIVFAIIAYNELYMKVGDSNVHDYINKGADQFTYNSGIKRVKMSYYKIPEDVIEDSEEFLKWCQKSYQVALSLKK